MWMIANGQRGYDKKGFMSASLSVSSLSCCPTNLAADRWNVLIDAECLPDLWQENLMER